MENKTKKLLKSKYSLDVSYRQLSVFIKEYNNHRMSLSECIKTIHSKPYDFYHFILEHIEIPLFKNVRSKKN